MLHPTTDNLTQRHRLSLAQIERIGWCKVEKEKMMEEKIYALAELAHTKKGLQQIQEAGLFFLLLKGVALSQRIYNDPTFRFCRDLDILVLKREDVSELRNHLIDSRWEDAKESPWVEKAKQREWYMDYIHHHVMWNPELNLLLEIHWNLDYRFLKLEEKELQELVLANYQTCEVLGKQYFVLKPELEFVYLLAHGARDGYYRLKWLVDILHYPFDSIDKTVFYMLLEKYQLKMLLAQANELLMHYFKQKTPFTVDVIPPDFIVDFCKKRMEGPLWKNSRSLSNVMKSEKYFYQVNPKIITRIKSLARNTIRHQDFSEIELNAKWKYYVYRYFSILKRHSFRKDSA